METTGFTQNNKLFKVVFPCESSIPNIIVSTDANNNTVYSGIVYELLNAIVANLKFQYEIVTPVDNYYGDMSNKSWNGLVGMAQRKEVDIIVGPLTVTYPRSTAIDFSAPFFFESIGIIIKMPDESVTWWKAVLVFTPKLWWTILGVLVGIVFAMRLLYHFDTVTPEETKSSSFYYCVWLVYSAVFLQMCIIKAKPWSNRIFQLSWRICIVLLVATYVCGLLAALATERKVLPFKDLKGLVEKVNKNEYKFCTPVGTAFYWQVMTGNSMEYSILKRWLSSNSRYAQTSFADCINNLLQEENVAFIDEIAYLESVKTEHCSEATLVLLEDRFFPGYLSFGFQKGSPLQSSVSNIINNLVETGVVEGWKRKFTVKPKLCNTVDIKETLVVPSKKLNIQDIGGSLILYAIGISFSLFGIMIEQFFRRVV